jgi:hypothetical protein
MSPLVILLVLIMTVPPLQAAETNFPGPMPLERFGNILSAQPLDWSGGDFQYLALGNEDGSLYLTRFRPQSGDFNSVTRLFLEGELTWLGPWEYVPGGGKGLVLLTRDPDRVLMIEVTESSPFFSVVAEIPLPEDPGTGAFVGPLGFTDQDLAVSLPGVDQLALLRSQGGVWDLHQLLPAGDDAFDLVGLDLDGDGLREIVTADRGVLSGKLGIYRRDEAADYARTASVTLDGRPSVMALHDFEPDGIPELVVALSDRPEIQILEVDGGELALQSSVALALPASDLHLFSLPAGESGLLAAAQERGLLEFLRWDSLDWNSAGRFYPGCRPMTIVTGDFNGEGLQDVVCVDGGPLQGTVLFGKEEGGFWGLPALALEGAPGISTLADFNSDLQLDLVVAGLDEAVFTFFPGDEDGGISGEGLQQPLDNRLSGLTGVDADGQLGAELATVEIYSGVLRIMKYQEGAGFQLLSQRVVQPYPRSLTSADVDRDGNADLVTYQPTTGSLLVLFGDGAGNFDDEVVVPLDQGAAAVATLDLNDDQLPDLVASDGSSRVHGFLNQGNRQFLLNTWALAGNGPRELATGDLDGDGDQDVVVANRGDHSLTFLENDGAGSLVRRIGGHALSGQPQGVLCADLNQTGNTDVVVNFGNEGNVGLVFGLGDWTFSSVTRVPAGLNISSLKAGDFNLDGFPDLLNLDLTLQLGLTMLNVERVLVDIAPSAVSFDCTEEYLDARVVPGGARSWQLAVGSAGAWQVLAADGQALVGRLDVFADTWTLRVPWEALDVPARSLRLVLGEGPDRDSLVMDLEAPCRRDLSPNGREILSWEQEPWPNPFNPRVHSRISLGRDARVRAAVYDLAGRQVSVLVDQVLPAGRHTLSWEGQADQGAAAAGVYFLRVEGPGTVLSRKLLLMK